MKGGVLFAAAGACLRAPLHARRQNDDGFADQVVHQRLYTVDSMAQWP